jgi:hypothetical protein
MSASTSAERAMDPRIENLSSTTFAGKRFTRKQLCTIQETCRAFPALSRRELAHTISEHLRWCTPTGKHKIQSCLSTLESLEKLGIVSLPAKDESKRPGLQKQIKPTSRSEQQPLIDDPLDQLAITVQLAVDKHDIGLWNELIDRHHYLGYRRPIGPHLRYFIVDAQGRKLGCLMFCYAVKSLPCRDQWIGWQEQTYKKHLNLLVNNNRFLIFPWVSVKCLASKALSMTCKQLGDDWQAHYNTRPVLVETFVDLTRFKATCYRAANWHYLGQSKGQSATKSTPGKTSKGIYVYPLAKNAKPILINGPERIRKKSKANPRREDKTPTPLGPTDPFVQLWQNIIGTVIHVARDFDQQWQKRQRVLNSLLIMLFIFRLVFSTNKQGYAMTITELWEQCRILGIELPQSTPVAASAFCKARAKLDEEVFKLLQLQILQHAKASSDRLWQGHRLFAVDGSKLNLPRQLIRAGYKTPSDNAHYPQGLVSCLYQLRSKTPVDFDLANHADERKMALAHLSSLSENDVVVYDRGYYSYEMLYEHKRRRIHPIFRLQMNACSAVDAFANSDEIDIVVHMTPGQDKRAPIRLKYPGLEYPTLALRLMKYEVGGTRYILGTSLLDQKKYSVEDLSAVYHSRWGVEELYKISKQLMKVEQFHAQSERGVKQELFAHFVLITLARIFANHSEDGLNAHGKANESEGHAMKANFKNCLNTVARNIEALLLQQSNLLNDTVNNILASISTCRQKLRPNRSYARCSRKPVDKWRAPKPAKPVAAKMPITA